MALFDKLKDAAGQGLNIAKDLGEKAKDLGETGAAKAKILMLEGKIKDVYEEIGKRVVEAGGVIPADGIADFIGKIEGFKTEIAQLEAVIKENAAAGKEAAEKPAEKSAEPEAPKAE